MRRLAVQWTWRGILSILLQLLLCSTSHLSRSVTGSLGLVASILFYFALLLTIGWLLFCTNRLFRNRIFLISCFAVLFVWGCASYFCWPVDREEGEVVERNVTFQIESVNRLLACFFSGSLIERAPTPATRLNYELLHFALIFFLGGWAFSLWGKGVVNRMRRHGILDRHLNVFWGVNEQGLALAQDILNQSAVDQVAFHIPSEIFDADEGDAEVRKLDGLDALWLSVDFGRMTRSLTKGRAHYFLSPSGEENMRLANALAKFISESDAAEKKTFHIRIESSADEQMFADWAAGLRRRVDIVLVREAEMVARQLMRDYPVLTSCPGVSFDPNTACVDGKIRLLVVGFGSVGWDVVEQMICGSRFSVADGSELPFECIVVDGDPAKWDEFVAYCPEAKDCYNIRFEKKELTVPDLPIWIAEQLPLFNRVVFCLESDGTNVELLSRVEKESRFRQTEDSGNVGRVSDDKPSLFVRITDEQTFACVEQVREQRAEDGSRLYASTRFFGCLNQIYRTAFLNFDELYEIASTLNAYHKTNGMRGQDEPGWLRRNVRREREKVDALWAQASFDDRLSSLSSAAGERNAMLLLGYRLVSARQSDVDAVSEYMINERLKDATIIDRLSRNEHYRWNAWHRMHGYRTWDLVHPPIEREEIKKANKLAAFGRHAAIVPYDELPEVDLKIARAINADDASKITSVQLKDDGQYVVNGKRVFCMQYWDRVFCRCIPQNLAAAGYCVAENVS